MANTGSPEWLKEELTKALGWDAMFMEGVVQAICDATSKAELQDLTEVGIFVLSLVLSLSVTSGLSRIECAASRLYKCMYYPNTMATTSRRPFTRGRLTVLRFVLQNFMGNDPKAASVIDTFLAARSGASQASGSSAASASASASGAGGPAGSSTAKPSYATSIRSAAPSADPPAAGEAAHIAAAACATYRTTTTRMPA